MNVSDEDKKKIAPSMMGMVDCANGEGWPIRDVVGLFLSEIWALEANAPFGKLILSISQSSS